MWFRSGRVKMDVLVERPARRKSPFDALASQLDGRVVAEGHEQYDEARAIWNALRDRRPAAIVRPKSVHDVVRTAQFARREGFLLSARSGGHGISGAAVRDGGITVDFSRWKGIDIDPEARIARVQPGVTWGELDAATQEFSLAVPGGKVATVGLGGSVLNGGIGWLLRKHGLAIDHLRSAEIVSGAGCLLKASDSANADLFWGIRGAGTFLGIVTSFEFDLVEVGPVIAGMVLHPFDRAGEVLSFFREFTHSAPSELTSVAGLMHGPDGRKMVGIAVTWSGDLDEGERVLAPVRTFGPPAMDMTGVMPYGLLQKELAKMATPGLCRSVKSAFLDLPNDDFFARAIEAYRTAPTSECMMLIEHLGGAANQVDSRAMAFPHRNTTYNLVIDAGWKEMTEGRGAYYWLASAWNRLRPLVSDAAYVGYLDADDIGRGVEAFGEENFARLRELKREHDPGHLLASLPGLRLA